MAYSWPGNVRELENVIERAVVLSTSEDIGPNFFPTRSWAEAASPALEHRADASLFDIMEDGERQVIIDMLEKCGLEPDRSRRAISCSAFYPQSEDQAAQH